MAVVKIYGGSCIIDVEITDELANWLVTTEHQEHLDERRETRRHQSLGDFCVADENANIFHEVERNQIVGGLKSLLRHLSGKQRFVLFHYSAYQMSFREIGEILDIHKDTVREHYHASVKKLQKLLKKHPVKLSLPWLLGEG